MKILIVSQYFWPENFRVNDLAIGLVERGHEVTILTGLPNYPKGSFFEGYSIKGPFYENYQGIKIIRVPMVSRGRKKGLRLIFNYLSFAVMGTLLGPFLCKGEFDQIFVYEVSPVTVGLPAIPLKYIKKAPIHFWVTDLWPETLEATGVVKNKFILGLVTMLVKFIYANCDKILVSSRAFIPKIEMRNVDSKKLEYYPYWAEEIFSNRNLNPEKMREVKEEFPKGFNLLFAGNLGTSQSFDTLLKTAAKLKHLKDLHWVILGDGLVKDWILAEIDKLGLKGRFHLLGSRPLEDMPYYYAAADALIVSLKKDPLFTITVPSKLQPCLASARPILGSIDGEASRILNEAGGNFVAPANSTDRLMKEVEKLYSLNEKELEELGEKNLNYFNKNFEREKLLDQLENMWT